MKKRFFSKLLSSSEEVSIRRFIALLCLPIMLIGAVVGIFSSIFNYYLVAMLCVFLPIMIAFFTLTWQKIATILKSIKFKNEDDDYNYPNQYPNSQDIIDKDNQGPLEL